MGRRAAAWPPNWRCFSRRRANHERAAEHYLMAADNAVRIFAHHEAVALARRGLAQLQTLPDTPDRARRELPLQMTLGMQMQVVQGYAAPEAERTYVRACVLCERLETRPALFPVHVGLWMFYEVRAESRTNRGNWPSGSLRWPRGRGPGPAPPGPPGAGGHDPLPRRPGRRRANTWSKGLPCTTPSGTAATRTSTGRTRGARAGPSGQWLSGCSAIPDQAMRRSRRGGRLGRGAGPTQHARAGPLLRRHAPAVPPRRAGGPARAPRPRRRSRPSTGSRSGSAAA